MSTKHTAISSSSDLDISPFDLQPHRTVHTWPVSVTVVTWVCPWIYAVLQTEPPTLCHHRHVTLLLSRRPAAEAGELACCQLRSTPQTRARQWRVGISCEAVEAGEACDWCGMRSGHWVARWPDLECLGRVSQSPEMWAVKTRHRRHCSVTDDVRCKQTHYWMSTIETLSTTLILNLM